MERWNALNRGAIPPSLLFVGHFLADIVKKSFSSYVGREIQKRSEEVTTFSPQTGRRHTVLEPKIR